MPPSTTTRPLAGVLAVLLATGYAANHFSATIPVLARTEGLSATLLSGAFGIYAVGLLPGLFAGGALSDRIGRPRVVLPGALVAALGNVVLMGFHGPEGLLVGRFVVGLGAGLTFGAGTAWAADLGRTVGTVLAGVFLTTGFATGPLLSGLLAQLGPHPLVVPFVVSALLSAGAVVLARVVSVPATRDVRSAALAAGPTTVQPEHSVATALWWSLPVGLLVFAPAVLPLVTLQARLPAEYAGPILVGVAATLTLGTGIAAQTVARLRATGPWAGVLGAACAAAGFTLAGLSGSQIGVPIFVLACALLGLAYGLCLREGLLDVESLTPPPRRGLTTGLFYVVTYLGFGVPLLLEAVRPAAGIALPALLLAAVALAVAILRGAQLRAGHPVRRGGFPG